MVQRERLEQYAREGHCRLVARAAPRPELPDHHEEGLEPCTPHYFGCVERNGLGLTHPYDFLPVGMDGRRDHGLLALAHYLEHHQPRLAVVRRQTRMVLHRPGENEVRRLDVAGDEPARA